MSRESVVHVLLALDILTALAHADDPTGTISGTVHDPSGAPILRARVLASNTSTGLNRETLTAADGGFVFPLVPVGPYIVSVQAPGFRRFEQRQVTITTDVNVTVPVVLQVGDVAETVTIEAQAGFGETPSGTLWQG